MDGHPGAEALADTPEQLAALVAVLEAHDAVLLTKPHPASATAGDGLRHERVLPIDDAWLAARGVGLYQLLGSVDALVTDLSSVYVDYLLMDRPIVFYFRDLEAYLGSRRLAVGSFDDFSPGHRVDHAEGLPAALDAVLGGADEHADDRRRLRDLCHEAKDAGSARRVLEAIGLLPAGGPAPVVPTGQHDARDRGGAGESWH